jgi:hypothetical protein
MMTKEEKKKLFESINLVNLEKEMLSKSEMMLVLGSNDTLGCDTPDINCATDENDDGPGAKNRNGTVRL